MGQFEKLTHSGWYQGRASGVAEKLFAKLVCIRARALAVPFNGLD
jgi:hypothetical protein